MHVEIFNSNLHVHGGLEATSLVLRDQFHLFFMVYLYTFLGFIVVSQEKVPNPLLRLPFISHGLPFLDLFLATQEKLGIYFSWARFEAWILWIEINFQRFLTLEQHPYHPP
jgi:hypothetical protein